MRQNPCGFGRLGDGHLLVTRMRLADDMQPRFANDKVAVFATTFQHTLQLEAGGLLQLRRCDGTADGTNGVAGRAGGGGCRCEDALRLQRLEAQHRHGQQVTGALPNRRRCDDCVERFGGGGGVADGFQKWCTETLHLAGGWGPHFNGLRGGGVNRVVVGDELIVDFKIITNVFTHSVLLNWFLRCESFL